jgi:hypothetical protein
MSKAAREVDNATCPATPARRRRVSGDAPRAVFPGRGGRWMFPAVALAICFAALPGPASAARNFFAQDYAGTRTNFAGNAGYEFRPESALVVTALGRAAGAGPLRDAHRVTIWDASSGKPLATVSVTPSSPIDRCGFANEPLGRPLSLDRGRTYRITSSERKDGDAMVDLAQITAHAGVAEVGAGVYTVGDGYPTETFGPAEHGYGLPTFYFDQSGVGTALLTVPRSQPSPFIRDVSTGYLLQCSFMSPRPYCWPGPDCLLSGWEVDRTGGNFAFQPNCIYPAGFAFHTDWFKLVDTNPAGAVTLRHQIARQTRGPITLEFRFKLPTRMDGACWQLRDMDQAGASLVTVGDDLCWGSGRPLMPYEVGREYGVKVVADVTAKTADVYVDGALKASGLPFAHPISSIDYVLVKTGDAATGEMFLSPVNIYKGYAVNETFVTCGVGRVPADWEATGSSVQAFECWTKPDIFSLRVSGDAVKRFMPIDGRAVYECRFLLPGQAEGLRVDLGGVSLAGLAKYRPNLWYMVKVITDPATGTADVFINGKPLATKVACAKPEPVLHFAGDLWVDDVQAYPWREYPADYVPQPKPCPAKAPYLLGVQSCNLWREGTAYAGWDYVYPYRFNRKPYLGWYEEGSPEEADWEIKWQVEHGITFEQHCWYRPNNAINHPIKDGVLDQGIIKGLFNARYGNLARFTIMCTDEGACETNPTDWRDNIIPYWVEYFFKDPRYLKVDGKPVVSIYQLDNLLRMFGGVDGGRQAIAELREQCRAAGLPGVIVLMEHRGADRSVMRRMKAIGVDYCYAYTWATPDVTAQRSDNARQTAAASAVGFGMLPSISMGWDRQAWGVHDGGWVPVPDYKALAQWTRDQFMPALPAGSLGRRMVMLANWNEFGEGHFLMPSTLAGFGYLDALRDVFTDGSPTPDLAPTLAQRSRFTTLYPRD